jgi:hypothetical protein
LLRGSSTKAALDLDWGDPGEKAKAIAMLIEQLTKLERWVELRLSEEMKQPPLDEHLDTLHQIIAQDLDPDPQGGGMKIKQEVAKDRRVSIEDKDMRHGRKTQSKRFNGYKRHLAIDLDTQLILSVAVLPANVPEEQAAPQLAQGIASQGLRIDELHIDRGYINAPLVNEIIERRARVVCRPWVARNGKYFSKRAFQLDLRNHMITCPAGEVQPIVLGQTVTFPAKSCAVCSLRAKCTSGRMDCGRSVSIADNEVLQQGLRELAETCIGRKQLRERIPIEHRQAHTCRRQGRKARYRGCRNNLFDLRRAATVTNLQLIQRRLADNESQDFANAA